MQYTKDRITGLKSSLRKMCILPGLLHFISRHMAFRKLNATYQFYIKSGLKRNYRQEFLKCTFYQQNWKRGTKVLQFDACCKAIEQNFDCGCDRCAILRLDSHSLFMDYTNEHFATITAIKSHKLTSLVTNNNTASQHLWIILCMHGLKNGFLSYLLCSRHCGLVTLTTPSH